MRVTGWSLVVVLFLLAHVVALTAALVSIAQAPRRSGAERVVWVLVVLAAPLAGSLAWFLLGRPGPRHA